MAAIKTVFIVGPTACGKTALSVELAREMDAEIICADSQTVRQKLDIGTAKPSLEERQGIPHYMLDVVGPYEEYSVADYAKTARTILADIHKRGKCAIVVGGSGLYIDALYYQFDFSNRGDKNSREALDALSVERLQEKIIKAGYTMPKNHMNKRHLIRTIERAGSVGTKGKTLKHACMVGIAPARTILIERISKRVEQMMESGFIEEVRSIVKHYGRPPKDFDAIGYRLALKYFDGEITIDELADAFKTKDRQYAKRQMTWFRRNPEIRWFDDPALAKSYILKVCSI